MGLPDEDRGEEPAPEWLGLLRFHTQRFSDLISGVQLEIPVPSCPGWLLRDLVIHLGRVHRWAAHAVVEGNPNLTTGLADDDPALPEWYRRQAAHLIEVLTTTPPDAPAWTLDEGDPTANFWRRRQVHETAMHTWDAEQALGRPQPMDPVLAWDGVMEVRDVIYPRQVRLGRIEPLAGALRLVASDVPGEITLGEGEKVTVCNRAEVLLRLLWHRADSEAVDPRAGMLLSQAITP